MKRTGSAPAFLILLAVAGLDSAGYSVIGPVLPALAHRTGASPAVAGLVVAAFPLAMLLGFVPTGSVMNRLGGRSTLLVGLGITAAGTTGFVFAHSLVSYAISRAVMGVGSGGLWMGVALCTLERWPAEGYMRMSRVFAGYSVGALLGPALGSLGGTRSPFLAYLVLVVLAAMLVARLPSSPSRQAVRRDRQALSRPGFWVAAIGIGFSYLSLGVLDGALPLHLAEHLSQAEIAGAYAGVGLIVGVGAVIAGHLDFRVALAVGVVVVTCALEVVGVTNAVVAWLPSLAIVGLATGLTQTGSTGALLEAVPLERMVSAMVVFSQMSVVGYFLGPVVGGVLGETIGYRAIGLLPAGVAAMLATAAVLRRRASAPVPAARGAPGAEATGP